jgi:hypothetical protein
MSGAMQDYTTGTKKGSRYPGGKNTDCDHNRKGRCTDCKARKRNGGRCDGNSLDCERWEMTAR